jgi:hypothetical protein
MFRQDPAQTLQNSAREQRKQFIILSLYFSESLEWIETNNGFAGFFLLSFPVPDYINLAANENNLDYETVNELKEITEAREKMRKSLSSNLEQALTVKNQYISIFLP